MKIGIGYCSFETHMQDQILTSTFFANWGRKSWTTCHNKGNHVVVRSVICGYLVKKKQHGLVVSTGLYSVYDLTRNLK